MKTLYIFRRDLRIYDNKALTQAYKESDNIFPIYVFNENYLKEREINLSSRWIRLVLNCLSHINTKIKINVFLGKYEDILSKIFSRYRFDSCYVSDSLSWIEEAENREIEKVCKEYGVRFFRVVDNFLCDPRNFKPTYNFFSFYKSWLNKIENKTLPELSSNKFSILEEENLEEFIAKNKVEKTSEEYLKIDWLEDRKKRFDFGSYNKLRNLPYLDGTSRLSHFISIGAVSVRELYNLAKDKSDEFIRQLAWREYYYAARFWYPWMKKMEVKEKMRNIEWENNKDLINAFFEGKTGYPIVDAGIRQLKEEGWIHNRVRLIVANFFVKDLIADWRIGEKFFRKYLIDYDEVLNVGNWQWCASVGIDPLPLRIFNPCLQSEKFDPRGEYIKKYLPELKDVEPKKLHNPLRYRIKDYIEPIVNHYDQIKKFKKMIQERFY